MKDKPKKLDFKKEFKYLFTPSAMEPEIVEVPAFKYIMVDGQGYPGRCKPENIKTIIRQPIKKSGSSKLDCAFDSFYE